MNYFLERLKEVDGIVESVTLENVIINTCIVMEAPNDEKDVNEPEEEKVNSDDEDNEDEKEEETPEEEPEEEEESEEESPDEEIPSDDNPDEEMDDTENDEDEETSEEETENDDNGDNKLSTLKLINNFIDIYNSICETISKISQIPKKNNFIIAIVEQVNHNFELLKEVTFNYIVFSYRANTYTINLVNYNYFLEAYRINLSLLSKIKAFEDKQ
ncbi:MAG: hypothetical protein PHF63_00450 [Herbinix sp.]|nr:hypothetical protein [Herbinix sp.]